MLINELSKITGVSVYTIRYYERYGLIKGKRNEEVKSNNYFHYNEETVDKLELIRDAKSVGFTLNEIKQLIEAWFNNQFSIDKKVSVLEDKLKLIDEKIKQLKEVKKVIAEFKKKVMENDC